VRWLLSLKFALLMGLAVVGMALDHARASKNYWDIHLPIWKLQLVAECERGDFSVAAQWELNPAGFVWPGPKPLINLDRWGFRMFWGTGAFACLHGVHAVWKEVSGDVPFWFAMLCDMGLFLLVLRWKLSTSNNLGAFPVVVRTGLG
jgi:hypothetical protein